VAGYDHRSCFYFRVPRVGPIHFIDPFFGLIFEQNRLNSAQWGRGVHNIIIVEYGTIQAISRPMLPIRQGRFEHLTVDIKRGDKFSASF
jgi:hypothetical protein